MSQNVDSRLAWFGSAPAQWTLARNKNAFRIVSDKVGLNSSDYQLLSLTLKGVKKRNIESGKGKFPASFDTYQEVHPNDIVFCLFDIDETPRTVGLSSHHGMITGAYTVVRCNDKVDPRFVTYFYVSIDQRKGLRPFYTGLRKVVRTDTFLNAPFPLPDLPTQKHIAAFLDRETRRLDDLIAKKISLMAGFSPRLEALVASALSDDSLPKIRLKYLAQRMQRQVNLSEHDELVRLGLYNRGRGIFKKTAADEEGMGDSSFYFVEDGDLILSGQFAWEGAVAQAGPEESGCVVSHRYPIYRGKGVETSFLLAFFRSKYGDFILNDVSRGSAGRNRPLNTWRLEKEKLPVPSEALQDQINKTVKAEAQLRAVHSKSIECLREYRAALITAAVTGQIDVDSYTRSGASSAQLDQIEEEMQG